jgi:hypothetical protein
VESEGNTEGFSQQHREKKLERVMKEHSRSILEMRLVLYGLSRKENGRQPSKEQLLWKAGKREKLTL